MEINLRKAEPNSFLPPKKLDIKQMQQLRNVSEDAVGTPAFIFQSSLAFYLPS